MRALFLLLLSCLPCLAQLNVQQPMFEVPKGGSFSPTDIATLIVWVNPLASKTFTDQTLSTPVVSDGDNVLSLSNSIPSAVNFTNSNATETHFKWYSTHNSDTNPTVYVDWSQTRLRTPSSVESSGEYWIFAVHRPDVSGYEGVPKPFFTSLGTYPMFALNNATPPAYDILGDNPTHLTTSAVPDATWQLLTMKVKHLDAIVRTNGVVSSTTGTFEFTQFDGFSLGSSSDNALRYRGDIAEILLYRGSLVSNDVWQVENYLRRHPFTYSGP